MRLAIAGGGPAGLIAAVAARQAGYAATVFEQAPSYEKIGGAIGVQSNGLRVLRALGLRERFDQHIEITKRACVESPPGRRVSFADFDEIDMPDSEFAVALRYDLMSVLSEAATAQGAQIHFGARCAGATDHGDSVSLQLESGQRVEADVVFACDGVRSAVRDSLGFRVQRRLANESYLRVIANIEHPDRTRIGEYWHPDGRRVGAFPLPRQRTYVFCSVPLGQWRQILARDLEKWLRSWDDFGPLVGQLMRAVDWESAVYDELSDVRVEPWARGRVFLLGDAAHAMTPNLGQGANSAMVDALVLINLLSENSNLAVAAARYQQIRRPFVTRIQNAAWFGGRMAGWKSAPARLLRDTFMTYAGKVGPLRRSSIKMTAGYNQAEQKYLRAVLS